MPVTVLRIEYDGSFFQGFQRQKNGISVQQVLEDAFFIAYKESVRIAAAGRTDTGVHARGMVVSFQTQRPIPNYHKLITSLNALAGKGVSVLNAREMPDGFHARFSCTEREYEYLILNSKCKHPLWESRAHRIYASLDWEKVRPQMHEILGRHEFRSFAKVASVRDKSTERQISLLDVVPSKDFSDLFIFKIRGTGFLHNMVRILVGTILEIATGRIETSLKEILASENRELAGATLPPHGLYFKKAYYKNYPEMDVF